MILPLLLLVLEVLLLPLLLLLLLLLVLLLLLLLLLPSLMMLSLLLMLPWRPPLGTPWEQLRRALAAGATPVAEQEHQRHRDAHLFPLLLPGKAEEAAGAAAAGTQSFSLCCLPAVTCPCCYWSWTPTTGDGGGGGGGGGGRGAVGVLPVSWIDALWDERG